MNASWSRVFGMPCPYSIYTEQNMTLVRLSGATSLLDSKRVDRCARCTSSAPLIRASFWEAM